MVLVRCGEMLSILKVESPELTTVGDRKREVKDNFQDLGQSK